MDFLSRRHLIGHLPIATPVLFSAWSAAAATIEVGAGASVSTPARIPWSSLAPGDEVVLRSGNHTEMMVVTARGTAARPIVIRAQPGAVLASTVVFEGAQHVRLEGLTIQRSRLSGVIIQRGSVGVTVQDCTVRDCGLGIWIGDGAGGAHRLIGNTLIDNQTHGVAIDVINAPIGQEGLIAGNRVARNGMHGMELNGNRYIVEGNLVWDNGLKLSGTSGIHTYCKDPQQDAGRDNIIRYNMVWGQRETTGQDGNGIQLDQWCDRNQVYFNICFANDGAGIALFDSSDNFVANNTLYDNMRDSGGRHAYKADLVLASDYTRNVDHVANNIIRNNLVVTRRRGIASIYVDPFGRRSREIAGNHVHHVGSEVPLVWNRNRVADLRAWNAAKPGGPDAQGDPQLRDTALLARQPPDAEGLRPRLALAGLPLPEGIAQRDFLGVAWTTPPIGALLSSAS